MTPEEVLDAARSLRAARPRRRRLRDGHEGLVPAEGRDGQVPGVQRRRVRAGHVQGPRTDAEDPAHADRGDRDRLLRGGRQPLVHLHPRRVRRCRPTCSTRRWREARDAGYVGEDILGSDALAVARRAPRRRRLHLRRGDRPARLARGQARQPAPEAAVPGQPGPLPGADADQQRRDARRRCPRSSRWAARSTRSSAWRPRPARSSCRSPATSSGPATTRSSSASPRARSSTTSPAARPRAARSSAGSPAAPPRRC